MANTFKLKTKMNVGVTTVGIYTAPASTTTVIIGVTLANVSGSGIHVGVGVTRPAADTSKEDIKLIKDVPIPQGSSFEFMAGNKLVLETEDTVTVVSDTTNSVDVALTIMEQT
tara:strand:+ start:159 stop:497 length:339 start_codon:yes stop_codon:yes gene_type:complete